MQQVLLDLGDGFFLSVVQGDGAMGSRSEGTVEVAVVTQNESGDVEVLSKYCGGYLDAKALADYILTYLQDRDEGALHD